MKYILILLILVSCYGPKKANSDFSRAVTFDPSIGVNYCARNYGCDTIGRDSIVYVSDSAAFNDALVMVTEENARMNAIVDSLLTIQPPEDTACYQIIDVLRLQVQAMRYRLAHIPPIRDTVKVTVSVIDRAQVEACLIDNRRLIASIGPTEALRDKYKKRAQRFLWILIACGVVIGAGVYGKVSKLFRPKLPI